MQPILVVDDEPSIATTLRMLLEDEGHRVLVAHDGQEALQIMAQERPSLVITDVAMPVMGGVELCRRMQDDPDLRTIPVVVMSAMRRPKLDGLAHHFIEKPFSLGEMVVPVDDLIVVSGPQADPISRRLPALGPSLPGRDGGRPGST